MGKGLDHGINVWVFDVEVSDQPQPLTAGNEEVAFFEKPGQGLGMPGGAIDKNYIDPGRAVINPQVRKSSQPFAQVITSLRRSIVFIFGNQLSAPRGHARNRSNRPKRGDRGEERLAAADTGCRNEGRWPRLAE